MELTDYLFLISFILCILYFVSFSRNRKAYKIFVLYISIVFIIDFISSEVVVGIYHMPNAFMGHFYFLFQFVFLSYFYANILKNKLQEKIVYIVLILIMLFLILRYVINPNIFFQYSLLEIFLTTIPIIGYAIFHLYNMLSEKREFYYINMGILIYLFGSTFLFLLYELNGILELTSNVDTIMHINIALQFVKFGFFFYEWKISYYKKNEIN